MQNADYAAHFFGNFQSLDHERILPEKLIFFNFRGIFWPSVCAFALS